MSGLSQKLLSLFSSSKLGHYKKGDILIRAEDSISSIYYIVKGFVRLYTVTKDGEERIAIFYKPGEMFPLIPALGDLNTKYFYETVTEVDAFKVSKAEFMGFLQGSPDRFLEIISQLIVAIRYFSDRVDSLEYTKAPIGLAFFLYFMAQKFGEKFGDGIIIQIPLTHKDIAGSMAMTRETVTRELNKLEKKRIITYKDRLIVIRDIKKLEELL